MKKTLLLFTAVISTTVFMAFDIQSDNGIAGYTGSPGENTCVNCHNSTGASNTGPGSITIRSNMNNWEYVPGQTYSISVVVSQAGRSLFGLGFEALSSSNTNAGTLTITNSTATRLRTAQNSRINVVHQQNGGVSPDSMVFTFNWTAPATNIGNVTFYFAGIAANNNGQNNGDNVYNSSKVATPATTTGLGEVVSSNNTFRPYINGSGNIAMPIELKVASSALVELYDLKGGLMASQSFEAVQSGPVVLEMEKPSAVSTGTYVVRVTSGNSIFTGKINLK